MKNIGQIYRKVREGEEIKIISPEINFFFLMFFYLPELTFRGNR